MLVRFQENEYIFYLAAATLASATTGGVPSTPIMTRSQRGVVTDIPPKEAASRPPKCKRDGFAVPGLFC